MSLIRNILLLMLGGTAVIFDVRFKRIPNFIVCLGLLWGALYQCEVEGLKGLAVWLGGALIPLLLISPLFFFRMIGAGDIKLFSVLGSFLGIQTVVRCIICSFIIGGIFSLVIVIINRNLIVRLHYFASYISELLSSRRWKPYYSKEDKGHVIHFSIPIFLSLLLLLGGVI